MALSPTHLPDNKVALEADTWVWNVKVQAIWEPHDKKISGLLKKEKIHDGDDSLWSECGMILLKRCSFKVNRKAEC